MKNTKREVMKIYIIERRVGGEGGFNSFGTWEFTAITFRD